LLIEKYCQPTIIFTGKTYFKIKRSKIATKVSGIRNYTTKRQEEKIQKRWKNGTKKTQKRWKMALKKIQKRWENGTKKRYKRDGKMAQI
jgi:hypothetical protein